MEITFFKEALTSTNVLFSAAVDFLHPSAITALAERSHTKPRTLKSPDPPTSNNSDVPTSTNSTNKDSATTITFASLVSRPKPQARFPDVPLPARQYGSRDGVPSISFSATEYQAAIHPFRYTLIAKFQIGRPTLSVIKQFVASNWCVKGSITMSSNWDDRHVVFILDSEQDVTAAITCPYRKVQNSYFRLFRWSPDYNPKKESTVITKWIRLLGLPMELFNRSFIKAIVSSFADFLDIDERTKALNSLSAARVCVELDVKDIPPSRVWINLPGDKGFYQDIIIEGNMNYCYACKLHGHTKDTCKKAKKPNTGTTIDSSKQEQKTTTVQPDANVWQMVNRKKGKNKGIQPVAVSSPGLIALQDSLEDMMHNHGNKDTQVGNSLIHNINVNANKTSKDSEPPTADKVAKPTPVSVVSNGVPISPTMLTPTTQLQTDTEGMSCEEIEERRQFLKSIIGPNSSPPPHRHGSRLGTSLPLWL